MLKMFIKKDVNINSNLYISQSINTLLSHDIEDQHFRPLYIFAGNCTQVLTYI